MTDPDAHLSEIELALIASEIIAHYVVVRSWANTDDGYIRVRATLTNGDFLEAAEYFVVQQGHVVTVDYRHQWMNANRTILHRRWDNTPHHPALAGFPDHCHVGSEDNVVPSEPTSLLRVLAWLENEMSHLQ